MEIEVSSSPGKGTAISCKSFVASSSPPYMGVIIKPEPGIWEELMDQDFMYVFNDSKGVMATVKYRIEVGESSIFFITSDSDEFMKFFRERIDG